MSVPQSGLECGVFTPLLFFCFVSGLRQCFALPLFFLLYLPPDRGSALLCRFGLDVLFSPTRPSLKRTRRKQKKSRNKSGRAKHCRSPERNKPNKSGVKTPHSKPEKNRHRLQ
jgi:hypothetical protein